MTVITKPNTILKKAQLRRELEAAAAAAAAAKNDNTVIYFEDEKCTFRGFLGSRRQRRVAAVLAVLLGAAVLLLGGAVVYKHCAAAAHRYRAFCAVSVPRDSNPTHGYVSMNDISALQLMQKNGAAQGNLNLKEKDPKDNIQNMQPVLRWSSGPDPDVQVFSTLDDAASQELITFLRESLDIQDGVEKITVFDNGKHVNFIHDFTDNITNIIDLDRCFSMELESEYILSPEVFTLSIEHGDTLDTSVIRSVWRAMLPPLQQLASWAKPLCRDKPAYKLQRESVVIRKRSVDEPTQEYMHFAGKHVMAIAIDNMAEIEAYEKGLKEN